MPSWKLQQQQPNPQLHHHHHHHHELIIQLWKDGTGTTSTLKGIDNIEQSRRCRIDTNDTSNTNIDRTSTSIRLPLLMGENWLHWYEHNNTGLNQNHQNQNHHTTSNNNNKTSATSQLSSSNSLLSHSISLLLPTIVSLSEEISDMIHLPPSHEEINQSRLNTSQNSHSSSSSCGGGGGGSGDGGGDWSTTFHHHPAPHPSSSSAAMATATRKQCCYLCLDVVAAAGVAKEEHRTIATSTTKTTANTTGTDVVVPQTPEQPIMVTIKDMRDPIIPDSFAHTNDMIPSNPNHHHHNRNSQYWTVHLHRASTMPSQNDSSTATLVPNNNNNNTDSLLHILRRRQSYQLQHGDEIHFRSHTQTTMMVLQYQYNNAMVHVPLLLPPPPPPSTSVTGPLETQLPPPPPQQLRLPHLLPPTTILNTVPTDAPDDTQLTSQDYDDGTNHPTNNNESDSENDDDENDFHDDNDDNEHVGGDMGMDVISQPDTIRPTPSETGTVPMFHTAIMELNLSTQEPAEATTTTTATTTVHAVHDESTKEQHQSPVCETNNNDNIDIKRNDMNEKNHNMNEYPVSDGKNNNNISRTKNDVNDDDDESTIDPRTSLNKRKKLSTRHKRQSTTKTNDTAQLPVPTLPNNDNFILGRPPLHTVGPKGGVTSSSEKVKQQNPETMVEPAPSLYMSPDLLAGTPIPHDHRLDTNEISTTMMTVNNIDTPLKLTSQQDMTECIQNHKVPNGTIIQSLEDHRPMHASDLEMFETAVSSLPPHQQEPTNDKEATVVVATTTNSDDEDRPARHHTTSDDDAKSEKCLPENVEQGSIDENAVPPVSTVDDVPTYPEGEIGEEAHLATPQPATPQPRSTRRKRSETTEVSVPPTIEVTSTGRSKRRRIETSPAVTNNIDTGSNSNSSTTKNSNVRILTTGFELDQKQKLMVRAIPGATLIEHIRDAHTATHIIATDGTTDIRRTCKLMIAICRSSNIVTLDWFIDSSQQCKALDIAPYRIKYNAPYCKSLEQQYANFSMRTTLRNIEHRRNAALFLLFQGWYIYLCPKVAGHKAPTTNEFQYIIEAAGATYISTMKNVVLHHHNHEDEKSVVDRSANILWITSDPPTKTQLTHIEQQTKKHRLSSEAAMNKTTMVDHQYHYHHRTTTWFFHTIMTQEITL